ncbi:helix-turn-helix domain-containing protein [Pseudomonas fluorescens]|uniref:helix-turn-helix domain-containing protein n=1 Tax=Pseudomonas fluorescens TaxID=294 RepID=UPI0012421EB8
MPTTYTHISTEERVDIMVMQLQQFTLRAIAPLLRRHPCTTNREIRRHSQLRRYDSAHAASSARVLLHKPRLCSGSDLFQVIMEMLRSGWPTQQNTRRLRLT